MADQDLRALAREMRDVANRILEALPDEPPPAPAKTPEYFDVLGFAAHLDVSPSSVRRLIKEGLPIKRVGRSVRIPTAAALAKIAALQTEEPVNPLTEDIGPRDVYPDMDDCFEGGMSYGMKVSRYEASSLAAKALGGGK